MINPAPIIHGNVPWSLQGKDYKQSQLLKKNQYDSQNHVHNTFKLTMSNKVSLS